MALQGERNKEAAGKAEGSQTEPAGDLEPSEVLGSRPHDERPRLCKIELVERSSGGENVKRDTGGHRAEQEKAYDPPNER